MRQLVTLTSVIVFFSANFAVTQEMEPLQSLIMSGSEETYPLVRCGGLYLSGLEWAGEAKFGKENSAKIVDVVGNIVKIAEEMRSSTLGEGARASVLRDVRNIADMYLARYSNNYAGTGQAWGLDPLWQSDTDTCGALPGE